MRNVLLVLTLALAGAPAFAGSVAFDMPHLTWPADDTVTGSTKGCEQPASTPAVCK